MLSELKLAGERGCLAELGGWGQLMQLGLGGCADLNSLPTRFQSHPPDEAVHLLVVFTWVTDGKRKKEHMSVVILLSQISDENVP